ncbi:MAG: mechanosensitive ion channel family protein [Actinomycetota bacterium]|nr:mechanosensitive ion channel family protein [Actinomycetota bacterium]
MLHLLIILQSEESAGEETTGVLGTAQEVPKDVAGELSIFSDSLNGFLGYLVSAEFVVNVVATLIVVALAIVFYRISIRLVPRILTWSRSEEEALNASTLARIKRQDTAVTLVRNVLRYVTLIIVALFVFSIFIRETLPAVAGAFSLVAIVGIGAQSFLRDIIAGFSVLFEGQYSVGDFIEVKPMDAAGMVEEFGLRTTKIRALSGELIYVSNGAIVSVRNYVSGQQSFTIEVQLKDEEAVERVLEEIKEGHELYLTPPRLVERNDTPEGGLRVRLLAGVLPSTAWLVEENLVERIKTAAGKEGLGSEPLVYKVDSRNVQRLRKYILEQ